jgi:hypothetical protein
MESVGSLYCKMVAQSLVDQDHLISYQPDWQEKWDVDQLIRRKWLVACDYYYHVGSERYRVCSMDLSGALEMSTDQT